MNKFFLLVIFSMAVITLSAQDMDLNVSSIPENLLHEADAVVRISETRIVVESYDEYKVTTNNVVTVLNKSGLGAVDAYQSYDTFIKVKDIRATIYDKNGERIDRIKQKDFKDLSAVSSGTLYSDSRVLSLNYTPGTYPITIQVESEVVYNSTAFFPSWYPIGNFRTSVERSSYEIINESNVALRTKEANLESYDIQKSGDNSYQVMNIPALQSQAVMPNFKKHAPHVLVTLERFKMEGVDGINTDWNTFGKWLHDNLYADVGEIPQSVKNEVKQLTKTATTDREKAAIVYKFMQDRSRYISVQVGIGGWKPIVATEVHEKAYGDCKGLTNYTKALLAEVGIKSDHAVIYGGSNIRNIDAEFSSTQGNHMILFIPQLDDEKEIWLECTSKTNPFGYIAGFTDNRDALVVGENGGEIIRTTKYDADDSKQLTTATIKLESDGSATGSLEMRTTGYQYSLRDQMAAKSDKDIKQSYQRRWDNLNGFTVDNCSVIKDTDLIECTEQVDFKIQKLANKMGDILLVSPVFFNKSNYEPPTYEERLYEIDLDRGYVDLDEYIIDLDPSLQIDALPEEVKIDSEFGTYELSITALNDKQLKVRRYLKVVDGTFEKSKYDDYEAFRAAIVKSDDAKAAIKLIQ
jgi:hypothetical protein